MLKAILFDIDDTLYDSTTLTTMARKNSILAMMDAGLKGNFEELYSRLEGVIKKFGPNYSRHYDELLKELGIAWSAKIIAAGVVAYERTKVGYLKPYPRAVPTLLELRKKYRLGVVSNGLAVKQWEKLISLGIHHLFDVVATSEEVGVEKPAKEIFLLAVKNLGLKPEECVMVGDRLATDIAGAKSAGLRTIRVRQGKYSQLKPESELQKPDAEINEISELPGVLEKMK